MPKLFYNEDADGPFAPGRDQMRPASEEVDAMVDEVATAGVNVFINNPNTRMVNYPSKVWPRFWDKIEPRHQNLPRHPQVGSESWGQNIVRFRSLAEQGVDYVARCAERCRERGMNYWVSIRMNDCHYADPPDPRFWGAFWLDHPEFCIRGPKEMSAAAMGFDYSFPEVREHYFVLIEELATQYELDGVEMDFSRHFGYFHPDRVTKGREIMTLFIARIRSLLLKQKHPIELSARVPTTLDGCHQVGLDVVEWSRHGLVDSLSLCCGNRLAWQAHFEEFRSKLSPGIKLYGTIERGLELLPAAEGQSGARRVTREILYGQVADHLAAGADAINLYNFFCLQEYRKKLPWIKTMADITQLRNSEKLYVITGSRSEPKHLDTKPQVSFTLAPGESRTVRVRMLSQNHPELFRMFLHVIVNDERSDRDLLLNFNKTDVAGAGRIVDRLIFPEWGFTKRKQSERAVECVSPATLVRDGWNEITISNHASAPDFIKRIEIGMKR